MKKILDVVKVGFHGNTGDNRSPEDFAFPSCMTSLMAYLGEDSPIETIHAHNQVYTKRTLNDAILAATGMAFGLLWSDEYCMSCMDLTQVNDHDETIDRAFRYVGYEYETILKDGQNAERIKDAIVRSIDRNIPVLAFGIIGPPECLIITGYDENGDVLIGWSYFQDEHTQTEPNGMFRATNWYDDLWKIVLPGKKTEPSLTKAELIRHAAAIMEQTESEGYRAGFAAYDAWIAMIEGLEGADDKQLEARHEFHRGLVGNLAEARAWGGNYLRHETEGYLAAADAFQEIHDTCWKVWGVVGDEGWPALKRADKRKEIADYLRAMAALDRAALEALKKD